MQHDETRVLDILAAPDHRLRIVAEKVIDVTDDVRKLVDAMVDTMRSSEGIGLAASQVGIPKRIIVMDVDMLGAFDDGDVTTIKHGKFEMINPMITRRSGKITWQEGCLSVPGFKESVERDLVVDVKYLDRDGVERSVCASGLLAACIQHEIDHLDGILFIDHISNLKKDMIIKKLKKFRKKGVMIVKPSAGQTF